MVRHGLSVQWRCIFLASLSLVVVLVPSTCAADPTVVVDSSLTTHSDELIRLGVNRVARNVEVEQLVAKYKGVATTPPATEPTTMSLSSLFHNFATGVSSTIWWSDSTVSSSPATGSRSSASDATGNQAVETKIRTGEGSHTITVFVGGQPRELILDTGSGKTAFICDGCSQCGTKHVNDPFQLTDATTYATCNPFNLGDEDLGGCMECHGDKCRYGQRYVEGDYWEAYKVSDTLSFSSPSSPFHAKVHFGCIYKQTGCFNEQSSDGIMGFSRHPDSIFEQFYREKVTPSRIFAQCLAKDGGVLTLGGVDMHLNRSPVVYTPLRDTGYQYWTVQLESISIGDMPLEVEPKVYNYDRGCVFDSGTTFVYLPTKAKPAFMEAWRRARHGSDQYMPVSESYHHLTAVEVGMLPPICFHFPNNATLCMEPEAYLFQLAEGQYAGTIFFGDEMRSTIIGASALMHHNIIYDVDNHRVGIAQADCDHTHDDTSAATATTLLSSSLGSEQMISLELHPGGDTFKSAVDREFWTQIALASVACCAVAGLVLTVWEELSGRPLKNGKKVEKSASTEKPAVAVVAVTGEEDDGSDFAFFLMEGDA